MDYGKVPLVICITIFLVVGINAAIYVAISRKNSVGQIELIQRATRRARNPWEGEDSDLAELSRRVAELKQQDTNHQEERNLNEGKK
jgi:hypothetical protein